jgi:hypothetical protein
LDQASVDALIKTLRGRVRHVNLLSADVGAPFDREVSIRHRGYRIRVYLGAPLAMITLGGFIGVDGAFTLNRVSRVSLMKDRVDSDAVPLDVPVFAGPGGPEVPLGWLSVPTNAALIARLNLGPTELLSFFKDGLVFVGESGRVSLDTLELLCDVADSCRVPGASNLVDGLPFDPSLLPEPLRALEPLIRDFAVGDDQLRTEAIDAAAPKTVAHLVEAVMPLMPDINAFLSSFGNEPVPPEAILLGRLAEAVSEILAADA